MDSTDFLNPEDILFTTGDDVIEKKELKFIEVFEDISKGRSELLEKTFVLPNLNFNIDDLHDLINEKILKCIYLQNRKFFSKKLCYFEPKNMIDLKINIQEHKDLEISFQNIATDLTTTAKVEDIFCLVSLSEIKLEYVPKCLIQAGSMFKLKLKVCFSQEGAKMYPLVLKLSRNESTNDFDYLLVESIFNVQPRRRRFIIEDDPINDGPPKRCIIQESFFSSSKKKQKNPFSWRKKVGKGSDALKSVELASNETYIEAEPSKISENILKRINTKLYADELKIIVLDYDIPKDLRNSLLMFKTSNSNKKLPNNAALEQLFFNEITQNIVPNKIGLNESNYRERFQYLLWLEEFREDQELHSYDQKGIHLIFDPLYVGLLGVKLQSLSEGRPSVLLGDHVTITPVASNKSCFGKIKEITDTSIYIKCEREKEQKRRGFKFISKEACNVTFELNRMTFKLSHHFLENMPSFVMENILFPSLCNKNPISVDLKPMFNESISSNELQCQAIRNIVQNTAFPAPYILFGPPGTGKTATFVEAIVQIWDIFDNSRICVCASSNAACNVITKRLMNYIPTDEMMRFYGLTRNTSKLPPEFESFSNYDASTFFPAIEEFRKRRVIIMTPIMAGKVMIRLKNILGSELKFDYLFMDEAGHCVETDALIPIGAFFENNFNGRLIISGDPKQLGPVVQSTIASELGFGTSYLERLMNTCELYKKDPETSQYNSNVITKLVNNYRSHEKILFTANFLFYENELKVNGSDQIISEFCSWDVLPTPNFPLIFHGVKGVEQKEKSSPSYFNLDEIRVIENYLKKIFNFNLTLKQEEVAVISPYKKQVLKIRERLKDRNFDEIVVGSVEEFQGQERKVIIVSTVRSRFELIPSDYKFGLGFLRNEKRLNVALTRAMALLIVIGNPDILQCDLNWKFFLDFCMKNGSFVGEKPCCISNLDENFESLSI